MTRSARATWATDGNALDQTTRPGVPPDHRLDRPVVAPWWDPLPSLVGSLHSALFAQQTISGLANGGIYASLAVALVLIYRATEVVNFAQGALATFATYIAWQLLDWGRRTGSRSRARSRSRSSAGPRRAGRDPAGGAARDPADGRDRLDRPADSGRGLDRLDLGQRHQVHACAVSGAHLPPRWCGVLTAGHSTIPISIASVFVLRLLFQFTKLGLAMRALPSGPRRPAVGIRVSWMLSLGWGLAAMLGAVAGMIAAASPSVLSAAVDDGRHPDLRLRRGGPRRAESPAGAVIGAFAIGVVLNLLGSYVSWLTPQFLLPAAFVLMLVVLLVKPSGLFGRTRVSRI